MLKSEKLGDSKFIEFLFKLFYITSSSHEPRLIVLKNMFIRNTLLHVVGILNLPIITAQSTIRMQVQPCY